MYVTKNAVIASALTLALLAGTSAFAQNAASNDATTANNVVTTPANPAPASAAVTGTDRDGNVKFVNNAYVTLSGTVGNILDDDTFQLNHSGGVINVEIDDDWGNLQASPFLKTGDRVTVTGQVDNKMFSANELEAHTLTVADQNHSRVYTDNDMKLANEADYAAYHNVVYGQGLVDDQKVRLTGEISRIVDGDKFMLRYGDGEILVDADDVDFTNATRLAIGDEVIVFGKVDKDWFKKKELEAERIVLSRAYSQLAR